MIDLEQYLQKRVEVLENHKAMLISSLLYMYGDLNGLLRGMNLSIDRESVKKVKETLAKLEE